MPKLPKNVEGNLTKQMKSHNYKRTYYTNTVLAYEKEIEPDFITSVAITTRTDTAYLVFSALHNMIAKNTYLIYFDGLEISEVFKIYEDKKKIRYKKGKDGFGNISDWWLNVYKEEELAELPEICEIGRKFIEETCGTIQKCLELYDSNKQEDSIFQSEMGWLYFGFLHAIYGDKKRAVELLEKFVNTDFSYEYMGEKRHSKCDVIRQKYAKIALGNIENKNKILELIKQINVELEII